MFYQYPEADEDEDDAAEGLDASFEEMADMVAQDDAAAYVLPPLQKIFFYFLDDMHRA
jgi:hypothetical protein